MTARENRPTPTERFVSNAVYAMRRVKEVLWPPIKVGIAAGIRIGYRDIVTTSSHLSYLTMFASVPLLVLTAAIMQPLGLMANTQQSLHDFLVTTGISTIRVPAELPASASQPGATRPVATVNLAAEIERVVNVILQRLTVERVGPAGAIILAWAAISLVTTLEKALNDIFGAQTRPIGQRLLLYWSVATLVPIVIAAAVYAAKRAVSHIEEYSVLSWIIGGLGYIGPTIVGILVVAMLYKFLPNTHVNLGASMIGASVAVPIWVVAKNGFQLYVRHVMTTGSIYGAFALLPVFLVWLNMSWLIFLWGAQLTHAREHGGRVWIEFPGDVSLKPHPTDLLAVAIVVARYFQAGLGAITVPEIYRNINLPQGNIRELLRYLETNKVVSRQVARIEQRYLLARPADKIRVLEAFGVDTRQDIESLTARYNTRTAIAIFRRRSMRWPAWATILWPMCSRRSVKGPVPTFQGERPSQAHTLVGGRCAVSRPSG